MSASDRPNDRFGDLILLSRLGQVGAGCNRARLVVLGFDFGQSIWLFMAVIVGIFENVCYVELEVSICSFNYFYFCK